MDTLVVTGYVTGKKYAIPKEQITLISEKEYGSKIDLKDSKVKHVECLETIQEIVQTLAAMN